MINTHIAIPSKIPDDAPQNLGGEVVKCCQRPLLHHAQGVWPHGVPWDLWKGVVVAWLSAWFVVACNVCRLLIAIMTRLGKDKQHGHHLAQVR